MGVCDPRVALGLASEASTRLIEFYYIIIDFMINKDQKMVGQTMVLRPTPNGSRQRQRTNHMTNIDNDGIENTQNSERSDDTQAIEAAQASVDTDAEYEAAFAAELAMEESSTEDNASDDLTQDEMVDPALATDWQAGPVDSDVDIAAIEAGETPVTASVVKAKDDTKDKAPPAHLAFMAAVEAHARALGLNVIEQSGFFKISAPTGHRIDVAKQPKGVSRIDTTLPRSALVVNGRDISLPLAKTNGRITCHLVPTVEAAVAACTVLAAYTDHLPAARKPQRRTSVQKPA